MAGESNPTRPPGIRPPPLLFQFPTLSPQPIWSIHAQEQQQQQQQQPQQMGAPPLILPPPQSLEFQQMPQQRFVAIPPQQQQFHQHAFQQQDRGGFCGNLNFQRLSPAPDLNSPAMPSPAHLGLYSRHHQKSQQMVFLERAGAIVDQTTFLKETSPLAAVLHPPPPPPLPPPRAEFQQLRQEQQLLDLSKRQFSSKNEARQPKKSKRMEMPAVQTPPPQRLTPFSIENLEQPEMRLYPAPLADHRNVVADEKLFLSTLSKFKEAMGGSSLRFPRFHGKDFEIHRLYCEVTEQGGMLEVTKDKKWKDIATAFDLPRNVTNPVFFLRKNYEKFLHHYEQVYFHRKTGAHIPPPGALPAPVSEKIKDHDSNGGKGTSHANPASSLGHTVTGAIEGKFEHGYFVTVVVGSEKLRGVIYSVPQTLAESQEQFADVESNSVENPQLLVPPERKAGVTNASPPKKKKRKRRVEGIKSVRNGYNFFVGEQRQKLKGGGGRDEMSKIIGDLWSNLSEQEKEPYREMSKRDKERFNREVEEKKQQELRASESHLDSEDEDDRGDDDDDDDDEKQKQCRSENAIERYNVQLNTNDDS